MADDAGFIISNGGLLACRLACATTIFAAIGPVAASQPGHLDQPSRALDATSVIWRFFAAHQRAAHPG